MAKLDEMTDKKPIRLLYVDDEHDLVTVVVRALRLDRQIDVRAVHTGAEALAIVSDNTWRPDLVLLDVMMPNLDGPGTFDQITVISSGKIPVIFFTARAQNSELVQLASRGAIGVMVKPFDPLVLAKEIRNLFENWEREQPAATVRTYVS